MIDLTLQAMASSVMSVSGYIDLFGMPPTGTTPKAHVKSCFRRLQKDLHPDRFLDDDAKRVATEAFARLNALHEEAERAIAAHRYGQSSHLAVMSTPSGTHTVMEAFRRGDLSNTFRADSKLGVQQQATFLKVVKDHRNNDLMKTEVRALKVLNGPDTQEKWRKYVSQLVDSFVYVETGRPRRRANVLKLLEGFYSLEQLRTIFPNGIPDVHAVWIWRRLLMTLGFAHDNGVVHGAVLPGHIMILPQEHGLTLVDWCYASIASDSKFSPLVAVVNDYKQWYPEEVLNKQAPSPATDIYLAARTMVYVLGGNPLTGVIPSSVPRQLRAFFNGCLQSKQAARPQNAWLLLQEFDELLENLGGRFFPRKFRPFVLPAGSTNE